MKIYELLTSNSFKTFYWSTLYMALVGLVDLFILNYQLVEMPDQLTVIVGIALTTISKALHNKRKSK